MDIPIPLSEFQNAIWRGQKLRPNIPLFNMIFVFDILGNIDADIFLSAFNKLVDTTASLKLIIDDTNPNNPKQIIKTSRNRLDSFIDFIDFSDRLDIDLQKWIDEKNQLTFDLAERSFHSTLLKKSDSHYIWYLNQHHIFNDAFSFQILFQKQSELYSRILDGKIDDLNDLNDIDKFSNYFFEVRETWSPSTLSETKESGNDFTIYGSRLPKIYSTESTRTCLNLDSKDVNQVYQRLSNMGLKTISPSLDLLSFLLTTFVSLLSIVGNERNLHKISNIISQRYGKRQKSIIGPLLKIIGHQVLFLDNDNFKDAYQKCYAILLSGEANPSKGSQIHFPIIVNFIDLDFNDFAGFKTKINWLHSGHMDDHHYIRFHIIRYKSDGEFQLAFDLKDFDENKLELRFKEDYSRLFKTFSLGNIENPLNKICILSESDSNELVEKIKGSFPIRSPLPLSTILFEQFVKYDSQIAIRFQDEEITYRELLNHSISIAKQIQSLRIDADSKIVVYLNRTKEYIYSILGCLFSGLCFVPVPASYPVERLRFIIKDVEAKLLIHAEESIDVDTNLLAVTQFNYKDWSEQDENVLLGDQLYILYTSGSTGPPKGVLIEQSSILNYLQSVSSKYLPEDTKYHMPLFTSIGFDLTMTSIFLPLFTGGSIEIFKKSKGLDLTIREVVASKSINCLKCTPSHLELFEDLIPSLSIKSMVIGGENLTRNHTDKIYKQFGNNIRIFNEYGPTEATIGCIVNEFKPGQYSQLTNVPIGKPIDNTFAFIANEKGTPLPQGVIGELCIGGLGLANKYLNDPSLTNQKFHAGNSNIPSRFYRSGDFARLNINGDFEFLGRKDDQIKISGFRIETCEIEHVIKKFAGISNCIVVPSNLRKTGFQSYQYCAKCGLPSNYPNADFNELGVCVQCINFETYKAKANKYFKTESDFKNLFAQSPDTEYDCIMLLSGGKDSTYALGKMVNMGLKVLAFTLDNGYIPESAKLNIQRVVNTLGVDHVFSSTPAMNKIFVDSLNTHCNVCNGCFKTIYTLSLKLAYEKKIPYIITGLSRGQFFETKLSEDIFWKPAIDSSEIDQILLDARKAYHTVEDAVYQHLDGEAIIRENILDEVQIVDFYRYHDVTLEELLKYINKELPWIRPDDTGRSTNCLINKVGIHIHKKLKGYSNYALPYSWDVRMGHKTIEETIDEIEEQIDEKEVQKIIDEIGYKYNEPAKTQLVAYVQGKSFDELKIKNFIAQYLPGFMIPTQFIRVDHFPLSSNGKIDMLKLLELEYAIDRTIESPTNEIEELLHAIWTDVLNLKRISIDDNFFDLGGSSMEAIRIVSRLEKSLNYKLSVNYIFELPTIQNLASHILDEIVAILDLKK